MRIYLPSCKINKEERIKLFFDNMQEWIGSNALRSLVNLFGGSYTTDDLGKQLKYLNDFVEIWDYRNRLSEKNITNERWNIKADDFAIQHAEEIWECCTKLGMVNESFPQWIPDYILPLGGARFSNLDRPMYVKSIIDENNYSNIDIVALSGTRPISEKEQECIDSYALNAKTEFEAINKGLEQAFNLVADYTEEKNTHENINLCSCIRKYEQQYQGCSIYSVAAPSHTPTYRANSRDTFEYFLKIFSVKKHSKLLLATTQIYVPYQLLKFADLAIESEFDVDCVGVGMKKNLTFSTPNHYLQEIKGVINAMCALYKKYGG